MSDVGYSTVQIDTVGTYVTYQGKAYMVGSTVTHQSVPGQFTTFAALHPIDDEGDMLDMPAITVNTDMCDIRVI